MEILYVVIPIVETAIAVSVFIVGIFRYRYTPRKPASYRKRMKFLLDTYEGDNSLNMYLRGEAQTEKEFTEKTVKNTNATTEMYIAAKVLIFAVLVGSVAITEGGAREPLKNVCIRLCVAIPTACLVFNGDLRTNRITFDIIGEAEKRGMDLITFIHFYNKTYCNVTDTTSDVGKCEIEE